MYKIKFGRMFIMTPYKNFISAAKAYMNSVPFLKFLLTMSIVVFGVGGFFYLIGAFVMVAASFTSTIGIILMYAGLLLTLIKEDIMTLVITSGVIAVGSFVAVIVTIFSFGGYGYGGYRPLPGIHQGRTAIF
jgi:hypothetical protein